MDSFKEWIQTQDDHPCLEPWIEALTSLGTSWDSFRPDSQEVVQDLIAGGIPLLAARDIVRIVSETLKKRQAPMKVFWVLFFLSPMTVASIPILQLETAQMNRYIF